MNTPRITPIEQPKKNKGKGQARIFQILLVFALIVIAGLIIWLFMTKTDLNDLVFGGWDIFPDSVYEAAMKCGVLEKELLNQLKTPLEDIRPMTAVFDNFYVKKLEGTHVKSGTKMDLAEALVQDMENFRQQNNCDRLVMVWCGSTEIFMQRSDVHQDLDAFENMNSGSGI